MNKNFNIIIAGVGGQGLVTLTQILAGAAMVQGLDVKTSELHGLSQRGGSVETHIRFGKNIFSPLVVPAAADFILSLEMQEALKALQYASEKTTFLINKKHISFEGGFSETEAAHKLNQLIKNKKYLISASEVCKKELGNEVVSGIYLLGYAIFNKIIPLKPGSVLKAVREIIPQKYLELNLKAFNLAQND